MNANSKTDGKVPISLEYWITCPGCGMSTWTERGCALPGCKNYNIIQDTGHTTESEYDDD